MELYNIKHPEEKVTFKQAVMQGMGKDQGLFFPQEIPTFSEEELEALLKLSFVDRSVKILNQFIGDEFTEEEVKGFCEKAFNFPVPIVKIEDDIYSLELFKGPTLAFKDFGARFLAQVVNYLAQERRVTIVTATSGDTGAAVAHAFYGSENVKVVVLYPKGKISFLQEKLFCTLGKNISTIAVDGDFDACQALVKEAFEDEELKAHIGLNSANSINISRLLAQITYYFEAYARILTDKSASANNLVVSVPSGNFGNLTAGMIAKVMGLPIKRYIASCNANDTVPRYLETGTWEPKKTVATLSNAMDVSRPNNWPRIEEMFSRSLINKNILSSQSVDDKQTAEVIRKLDAQGYVAEPHGAVGYKGLRDSLVDGEVGLFLETAQPAKFKAEVENILGREIPLPEELATYKDKELLSLNFRDDYQQLRDYLFSLYN